MPACGGGSAQEPGSDERGDGGEQDPLLLLQPLDGGGLVIGQFQRSGDDLGLAGAFGDGLHGVVSLCALVL